MARAGKNPHSKMGYSFRRWSSGHMMLAFLLLFSLALLVLLSLGILSLNTAAPKTPHDVSDLTSLKFQTDLHSHQESEKENERKQWMEVLSWEPRAFIYHNFLTHDECDYLTNLAKPHMRKSTVVDSTTGKSQDSRVRTSSGTFLQRGQDKIIRNIEKRIADFTFIPYVVTGIQNIPASGKDTGCHENEETMECSLPVMAPCMENGEGLQVLHYEVGQKYEPHFDYFLDEFNTKNGGQRIATVLMYLTDVEEGGETVFPSVKVNSSSIPYWDELSECGKTGLSVRPKKGDALLFWSMKPDATLDPLSLHGGCPVIKGNKWSSTKWMRINEYRV